MSGVAAYFGFDPLILRLIYLMFLFLGFGFILYVILWIVVPKATTAADKLQMRGEPVTAENIKRAFEEGAGVFASLLSDAGALAGAARLGAFTACLRCAHMCHVLPK